MTIHDIQKKLQQYPILDIELLIAHSIGKPKEFIFTYPHHRLTLQEVIRFWRAFFAYKHGYSIAAITNHKEFYGLDFFVNKHVLIPRPDTELMVDEAKRIMDQELRTNNILHIDVGTGSGCIPISVLKTAEIKPATTIAIDISRTALHVAKKNARQHEVNIHFLHGNLLQPLLRNSKFMPHDSAIITANLPYLTEEQFKNEPSIKREPKKALVAKNNGLALYEQLLAQTKLLPSNLQKFLLLEIDPSQTTAITVLITQILPAATIEIKKDLSGLDRLVIVRVQPTSPLLS